LQKKLKLIGKKQPNRLYFKDNALIFTNIKTPKKKGNKHGSHYRGRQSVQADAEERADGNYLFPSDDENWVIDENGVRHWVGDGIYAPYDPPTGDLPF
jgi:hypothetical protein